MGSCTEHRWLAECLTEIKDEVREIGERIQDLTVNVGQANDPLNRLAEQLYVSLITIAFQSAASGQPDLQAPNYHQIAFNAWALARVFVDAGQRITNEEGKGDA